MHEIGYTNFDKTAPTSGIFSMISTNSTTFKISDHSTNG